jgi:hypothetical protein
MKTLSVVKAALGGGAAILATGLLAAPGGSCLHRDISALQYVSAHRRDRGGEQQRRREDQPGPRVHLTT